MNSARDYPDSEAVEQWLQVKMRLEQGRLDSQALPLSWRYPLDKESSREPAAARWVFQHARTNEPVSQLLDRWLKHGIVDDSSEELRWMFLVRFDPAIDLVGQMMWSRGHLTPDTEWTGMFPFPSLSIDEVVKSLLGDWWCHVGCHLFFDRHFDIIEARQ